MEQAQLDDIIHLGSCTKAMTAVVIGQLCTEGKLKLDSTLQEIFKDVEGLNDTSWGSVTITELLQHRSGAIANLNWHQFDTTHPTSVIEARRMMLEQLIKTRRPKTPKFIYSNVGYATLGHIAEQIEGKSWEEIVTERVFKPLDMKTASFGPVGNPDGSKLDDPELKDRAWGHTEAVDVVSVAKSLFGGTPKIAFEAQQIDNSPSLGPAGRAHMSLGDWSKFVLPFARKDGYQSFGISHDIWQQMLTPKEDSSTNDSYAAGWIVFDKPLYGGRAYFHNGSNTTWYCYAIAAPEKGYVILVATNVYSNPARQACDEIAKYLEPKE